MCRRYIRQINCIASQIYYAMHTALGIPNKLINFPKYFVNQLSYNSYSMLIRLQINIRNAIVFVYDMTSIY